jgi:MoaA/NifB/PqqE/SkfB family radical SAM enzyme
MLEKYFCSSPWIHLQINHDGSFTKCRWAMHSKREGNFSDTSIVEFYNGDAMKQLRSDLLNGKKPSICSGCHYEESFGKISGRTKQLLKSGIDTKNFALTARSSPHYDNWKYSWEHDGKSDYGLVDLQIDLSNICNSACIMCNPSNSSKLTADYKKLNKINPIFEIPKQYSSWTNDPVLLERVVKEISELKNLKYIQFLGGETLFDPAFYSICDKLIETGLSKNISIGVTTNGTIYNNKLENIIKNFKEVFLGISIESITEVNDYVRYPSSINQIKLNIDKFLELRNSSQLKVTLRITPNIFTVYNLDKMIMFMIEKNIIAESCNILAKPEQLRMELLPEDIRQEAIRKLKLVIDQNGLTKNNIVNIKANIVIPQVIADVAVDYLNFLETYTVPDNVNELRYKLVDFIKAFESLRQNSILDYEPDYAQFLRSYGY